MVADLTIDEEMRLIHRTNYWGQTLNSSDRDREVDMDAIWVQVVKFRACCPNFGDRNVRLNIEDLQTAHDGLWNLFFVSGTEGRDRDHFFSKLVMIPHGKRGYGKDRVRREHGWTFHGSWNSNGDEAKSELTKLINGATKGGDGDRRRRHHIHLGIHMDSCQAGKGNSW
jgi:hypothetical protein